MVKEKASFSFALFGGITPFVYSLSCFATVSSEALFLFKKTLWRIPRFPLPLFDGEAERAETATESEVVAVSVGKEVGALQTELAVAVE